MNEIPDMRRLKNGIYLPAIGYGTYQMLNEDAERTVGEALKAGYRNVDTAAFYNNEIGIGRAIRQSGFPREEIFISSKVWNTDRGYETTKAAFHRSLENLGLDYLDLYLIHWPANRKQFGEQARIINQETWNALEELYQEGVIKAIGLSNFLPHHIEELLETAAIEPMVDQIEFHPGWAQLEIVDYCLSKGILVEAWSPLGERTVLSNETLITLAHKYQKSVAQMCIRWALQHGVLPLPKSADSVRMRENKKVFDFAIEGEDMKTIDALQGLGGQCALPDEVDF